MLIELLMSFSNYVCSYRVLIPLEEIRTEEPTLYLIFPVIVIVISASKSYEINIVESTMTMSMTGKTRYIHCPT